MVKKVFSSVILIFFLITQDARASMFGEENVPLYAILAQAIQQVIALKKMIDLTSETIESINSIKRSVELAMGNLKSFPIDPGLFDDWTDFERARQKLAELFGTVPNSVDMRIQKDADQGIAEAITNNNRLYEYAKQLDNVAEDIKRESFIGSTGNAQKVTAHALGIVIQVLNQNLRAQASSNKLQAHSLAIKMHEEKVATQSFLDSTDQLSTAMRQQNTKFEIPRF